MDMYKFNTLFYWSIRATGPTILATVGITVGRVTSTFLTVLLRFLKPLFELSHLFLVSSRASLRSRRA